jgi:hypothetical protein
MTASERDTALDLISELDIFDYSIDRERQASARAGRTDAIGREAMDLLGRCAERQAREAREAVWAKWREEGGI